MSKATLPRIPGGFILLSRRLVESEIMRKPPLYVKVWVWLLLKANYADRDGLLRGQLRTSIDQVRKAMAYRSDSDV